MEETKIETTEEVVAAPTAPVEPEPVVEALEEVVPTEEVPAE